MESLIMVFHKYASRDGKGTLNRRELRELMENELSEFLKVRPQCPVMSSFKHFNCEAQISQYSLLGDVHSASFFILHHSMNHSRQVKTKQGN